jgi:hypothetical protein
VNKPAKGKGRRRTGDELLHVTLMRADLARSGLNDDDIERIGVVALDGDQTSELTDGKFKVPSYKIPYFNAEGLESDFYRLRFTTTTGAFKVKVTQRYWQPNNTLPHAYFAPGIDWAKNARDPTIRIAITEGEKKAFAGSKHGLTVIGLGGVWAFRSKKAHLPFLPELEAFDWEDRDVELTFDSDVNGRADLLGALYALGDELVKRGARVARVDLPKLQGQSKTGLDDYLLVKTAADYLALPRSELPQVAALYALNAEYGILRDPAGEIFDVRTRHIIRPDRFLTMTADRTIAGFAPSGQPTKIHAGREWITWPKRRVFSKLVYEPRATDAEIQLGDGSYNLWPGWGVAPKKGDLVPFRELMSYLFADAQWRTWVTRWLAYPLQHPGVKLYSAVVLWGKPGIGKSIVGYTMKRIYGADNFVKITQKNLQSAFNSSMTHKQFVLAEEVGSTQRRGDADELKDVITRETVMVNKKFVPEYELEDHANFWFTSNHPDPIKIDDSDRRYFVWRVPDEPLAPDFYAAYYAWLEGGGAAALFHHLLREVDVSSFNPKGKAPDTEYKRQVVDNAKSDLRLFLERVVDNYDAVFSMGGITTPCDLQSVKTLLDRFRLGQPDVRLGDYSVQSVGMILRKLRDRGVQELPRVAVPNEGRINLYAFRNQESWKTAPTRRILHHWLEAAPGAARVVELDQERMRRKLRGDT